jgi:hypothetical protein
MKVIPYASEHAELWDNICSSAPMATFLHTRRFLSYHGDRFNDVSLILVDEHNRVMALFPAAVDPSDNRAIVSHPGITYGGLLRNDNVRGARAVQAIEAVAQHFRTQGFETIKYKAIPHIYHRRPCADDSYALFRLKAVRYRCDLSCAIDLRSQGSVSDRRSRGLKKAQRKGVSLLVGNDYMARLWPVLEENLEVQHGVRPTHTLREMAALAHLFPMNIRTVLAVIGDRVIAGLVSFVTDTVAHAQYIASNEEGKDVSALDMVFSFCIEEARTLGLRFFDFGISTESEGAFLNEGLYQFKSEFGGGGVVHEFYELNICSQ